MANSRKKQNQPIIKQEPGILINKPECNSPGRLSSFKLPRDLTLGGQSSRKAPKKVYTPNLNAVRVKKQEASISEDSSRGRGRGRGRGNRTPGERGRGRGRASLIQSDSVFSEGTAAALRRSSSGSSNSFRDDASKSIQKPTISHKVKLKVDNEEENEQLLHLLEDDEMDECPAIDNEFIPTVLPTTNRKHTFNIKKELDVDKKPIIRVKKEEDLKVGNMLIKEEPVECSGESIPELGLVFHSDVKVKEEYEEKSIAPPNSVVDLFTKHKSSIFLLQLPDTLPGQGPELAKEKSSGTENKEQNKSTPEQNATRCTLRDLGEGRMGRVIMYKSGKTKLILGDTIFDLSMGTQSSFLQEVMSVDVNPSQRSGNMINLGPVQAKLIASPDWNVLTCKQS